MGRADVGIRALFGLDGRQPVQIQLPLGLRIALESLFERQLTCREMATGLFLD